MFIVYVLIMIGAIIYYGRYYKKKKKIEQNIVSESIIENTNVTNQLKKCPFCYEEIHLEAKKCKHCGEYLDEKLHAQMQKEKSSRHYKFRFEIIPAILIIIAFFLPWLHLIGFNISGYDLPDVAGKVSVVANLFMDTPEDYSWLMYLIPILSVFTIISGITNRLIGIMSLITSLFSLFIAIFCFYVFAINGDSNNWMIENIGIGLWINLFASFILFIFGLAEILINLNKLLYKLVQLIKNRKHGKIK